MPPPAPAPASTSNSGADISSLVTHLETDWRKLIVGRKHLMMPVLDHGHSGSGTPRTPFLVSPPSHSLEGTEHGQEHPLEHQTIIVNVVGTDGPRPSSAPPSSESVSTTVDFS